jgi:D-methionine transport system ATP-binding protein
MLRIKNLIKHYTSAVGKTVGLNDISLEISKGEIFGIIGKSGAGKSTLIRCLNLLEKPTSGEIYINNENIITLSKKLLRAKRHKIGMIFQHFNLIAARNVYENIALPLKLKDKTKEEIETTVNPLLELTGLIEKKWAYPAQLSGGQKQRVAIARALASNPEILLCDEATSALDPHTTQAILELLKNINQTLGITIIVVTHEMRVIKDICDRVAVLDHGNLIECGEVLSIFTKPQHPTTRDLISTALRLDLPKSIKDALHDERHPEHYPLLRFTFVGNETAKPFLSELTENLQIRFNILQANIELIHGNPVGIMLVQALVDDTKLKNILTYAEQQQLKTEVLGYVL